MKAPLKLITNRREYKTLLKLFDLFLHCYLFHTVVVAAVLFSRSWSDPALHHSLLQVRLL